MTASTDWPIGSSILAWEHPSLTEKPGRLQSTGTQRARTLHGHYRSDSGHTEAGYFLSMAVLPQWDLSMKVVQLLGLRGPWWSQVSRDTGCLCCRSYGPFRDFCRVSCSWWWEGLFVQSFSIARPLQALRGLSCLVSFYIVWPIRHIKRPPVWGPTL